jgi:hypothetical protein
MNWNRLQTIAVLPGATMPVEVYSSLSSSMNSLCKKLSYLYRFHETLHETASLRNLFYYRSNLVGHLKQVMEFQDSLDSSFCRFLSVFAWLAEDFGAIETSFWQFEHKLIQQASETYMNDVLSITIPVIAKFAHDYLMSHVEYSRQLLAEESAKIERQHHSLKNQKNGRTTKALPTKPVQKPGIESHFKNSNNQIKR